MRPVHPRAPICAAIAMLAAAATVQSQPAGYWKYVRTDSGIYNGWSGPLHDSAGGGEGSLTLTDSNTQSKAVFSVAFSWNTPPDILIPGAYVDWRVSGKVVQNSGAIHPAGMLMNMVTHLCGYISNPATACGSGNGPGGVVLYQAPAGTTYGDPVGTVKTSANLQQPTHKNGDESQYPPYVTPGGNSGGMLTWQVYAAVQFGGQWIWYYQYQWVAGAPGGCSGSCTLGSSGQTMGANGGAGSVSVSATSSWNVATTDNWIQITSPTSGNGNSSVTFTVKPNTGTPRIGTILIGCQPYNILQDGGATGGGPPQTASVSPAAGVASSQPYTFTFSDPDGWQDLDVVNILINNFLDGRSACYLAYSRPYNVLYLVNDAGSGLLPGMALNGSGSLSNSMCTIHGAGSSVTGSGSTMTLTLVMSFGLTYAGNKVIYMAARDLEGGNSGWQAMGTCNVPAKHQPVRRMGGRRDTQPQQRIGGPDLLLHVQRYLRLAGLGSREHTGQRFPQREPRLLPGLQPRVQHLVPGERLRHGVIAGPRA